MKKIITSITVCALAVCSLASCSDNNNADIVGKWAMDDASVLQGVIDEAGFIFSADGKGSLYENTSSIMHFTSSGLDLNGTVIGTEYISTTGDVVSIDISGQKLISMTRITYGDSQYDGKYTLDGGVMYDTMVSGMAKQGGISEESLNVTIEFNGSYSEVIFNDLFTYSVSGNKLITEGLSGFFDSEGKAGVKFSISGDTLTLKGKSTETLTRVG